MIILIKFQNIPSLDKLTTALSEADKANYCDILRAINFSPKELSKYSSWSEDYYTRNCILNCDKFELILICWCKSHKTPIHDHGGEECWVKVISGQLEEVIYGKNENDELTVLRTLVSKKNQVTYMKDFMGFHSLENTSDQRSMTLHLYAKPIRKCNVFDEDSKTFINKEMVYHTIPN